MSNLTTTPGSAPAAAHHHHLPPTPPGSESGPCPAPTLHDSDRRPQHVASPRSVLTFSDLPDDLAQLKPLETQRDADANPIPRNQGASLSPARSASQRNRKPSPGLAARLKALGFGSKDDSPTPLVPGPVGRLPEDQIRQIDQKHQANSSAVSNIERRGRPWKGAGAPLALLKSKSSLSNLTGKGKSTEEQVSPTEGELVQESEVPGPSPRDLLPEIEPSEPLAMDTNKYRLPDHTNGNGTKALSDTRQEHLSRGAHDQENLTPPPPLPKDTPPEATTPGEWNPDAVSYFNPLGLQRAGSIYTISRLSFANQLAQLTSLQLPDAESLSSRVSAIPTAQAAAKALIHAAEQIRMWISKASEVISGLDSDDDVEWAAAGGREGYEDVENSITRFEELINVYVGAIEELQGRDDISSVSGEDLQKAVTQMESIMAEWQQIRSTLNTSKAQIEIAMEWEELWNMVLGDIQNEMDDLIRLVFEMEERRHKSLLAAASGDGVDIGDLETIVEETPPTAVKNNRFSMPAFPMTPSSPATPALNQDDSNLLALFARMQPLRASLDFLPMRLSVFEARAEQTFPTACEELDERRTTLEEAYKKLEKDAESVRKELGEDKWVLVFRGAGRQAQKMSESVERSVAKLREAVDAGTHLTNPAVMGKKIESYEAKKTHYGPAIERVMSIIDKGVKDRLTVNGEILRLHAELQSKWDEVKTQIRELDMIIDEMQTARQGQALRDSVSSMLSNDLSTVGSGHDTPGSSPPSSVVMASLGFDPVTPSGHKKNRSVSTGSALPRPASSRRSTLGVPSQVPRKPLGSKLSTMSASTLSRLTTPARSGSATPLGHRSLPRAVSSAGDDKPKWNASVNTNDSDVGHNFKPMSLTTPSPYSRKPTTPARPGSSHLTSASDSSKIPTLRSPLSRGNSSPITQDTPSRKNSSRLGTREGVSSPGPYAQQSLARSRLTTQQSMSAIGNRRASLQPPRQGPGDPSQRPASSLATSSRRTSMLPQARGSNLSTSTDASGRYSPQAVAGARTAMRRLSNAADTKPKPTDNKPRWHF